MHPYNWLTGHNINLTPGTITNTVSMDQVAARHLGPTWLPSLALSFADGVGTATLSRNALGVDIPATANHRQVFERLFPPADRDQLRAAQARLDLNRSILDTAGASIRDFQQAEIIPGAGVGGNLQQSGLVITAGLGPVALFEPVIAQQKLDFRIAGGEGESLQRFLAGEFGFSAGEQDPPGSGNGGLLSSDAHYGDFELELEMRPDWGPDTGVFFRCTDQGHGFQFYVDYHKAGNVGQATEIVTVCPVIGIVAI